MDDNDLIGRPTEPGNYLWKWGHSAPSDPWMPCVVFYLDDVLMVRRLGYMGSCFKTMPIKDAGFKHLLWSEKLADPKPRNI